MERDGEKGCGGVWRVRFSVFIYVGLLTRRIIIITNILCNIMTDYLIE